MSESGFTCQKCGGALAKGFLSDRGEHSYYEQLWVEGIPEHMSILGFPAPYLKISDRKHCVVKATRCERCGHLELYAIEKK